MQGQATFHGPSGTFKADTCAPLRSAAARGELNLWAHGRDTYPGERLPADVLPQLRSVGMWEATQDQHWGLDWHRNEGIEITCVTSGRTSFSCDGRDYDLPAGTITITRPWQLHRVGRPDITASTLCWFIIDVGVRRPNQEWRWPSWLPLPEADLARFTALLRNNERPVWPPTRSVSEAVGRLERTLRGNTSLQYARLALGISEIILEMTDLLEHHDPELDPYLSSTERTVELFLHSLTERLDEPWTVESMAAACGLGKTRFVHYCKKIVNLSPIDYLTTQRVKKAIALLEQDGAKISDVAFRCGFQSSQYFSTVFRRHTGAPPSRYRARP